MHHSHHVIRRKSNTWSGAIEILLIRKNTITLRGLRHELLPCMLIIHVLMGLRCWALTLGFIILSLSNSFIFLRWLRILTSSLTGVFAWFLLYQLKRLKADWLFLLGSFLRNETLYREAPPPAFLLQYLAIGTDKVWEAFIDLLKNFFKLSLFST